MSKPKQDKETQPKTVVVRYVGMDKNIEAAIKSVMGKDPDSAEFGYPSVDGNIYKIRIMKFQAASEEEAAHMLSELHSVAGVEQFAE